MVSWPAVFIRGEIRIPLPLIGAPSPSNMHLNDGVTRRTSNMIKRKRSERQANEKTGANLGPIGWDGNKVDAGQPMDGIEMTSDKSCRQEPGGAPINRLVCQPQPN